MTTKIQKTIMRRVWYAYAIRQLEGLAIARAFWQGVVFGGALMVFAEVVHVASVFRNLLQTPLGGVPEYVGTTILTALQNGDIAKVVTLALLVSVTISLARQIIPLSLRLQRPA
jgi:hypothetical protein